MAKVFDGIELPIREFIEQQKMFFVATAPLAADGHVNLSPKGLDSLRILDDRTVVYADLTGSGVETIAHLKENRRIVLMFCAFAGAPKIVRLHGVGEVIEPGHADFEQLKSHFSTLQGLRSFIRLKCERVSDSCGWGVPVMEYVEDRSQLIAWADKKGSTAISEYQQENNSQSLDGLPGVSPMPN